MMIMRLNIKLFIGNYNGPSLTHLIKDIVLMIGSYSCLLFKM